MILSYRLVFTLALLIQRFHNKFSESQGNDWQCFNYPESHPAHIGHIGGYPPLEEKKAPGGSWKQDPYSKDASFARPRPRPILWNIFIPLDDLAHFLSKKISPQLRPIVSSSIKGLFSNDLKKDAMMLLFWEALTCFQTTSFAFFDKGFMKPPKFKFITKENVSIFSRYAILVNTDESYIASLFHLFVTRLFHYSLICIVLIFSRCYYHFLTSEEIAFNLIEAPPEFMLNPSGTVTENKIKLHQELEASFSKHSFYAFYISWYLKLRLLTTFIQSWDNWSLIIKKILSPSSLNDLLNAPIKIIS